MKIKSISAMCVSFLVTPSVLWATSLVLSDVTVGRNLQVPVQITLDEPAPDEGLELVIRSSDPNLLKISLKSDRPGAASVTARARPGNRKSQEFWLQALGDSGTATYTAEARGIQLVSGKVTLAPSGILVSGPYRTPKFPTTTGGLQSKIRFYAARLDSSRNFAEEQLVSETLKLEITNSNPSAGRLVDPVIAIPAGTGSANSLFQPSKEGEATFVVKPPPGFSVPAEFSTVTASVRKPGVYISDDFYIGKDLQVGGAVALGEYASPTGLVLTLTSADPTLLLLSKSSTEVGSKSIQIQIPPEGLNAVYFLQALGSSGEVEYTATAPGFRSRTAVVKLAPSGITLTPYFQGPPDEAQVLTKQTSDGSHGFTMKKSETKPMRLIAWTAQLDPITHRSADITVQPLRAGLTITIPLTIKDPAIGKIAPLVKIAGGSDHGSVDFTPSLEGTTEISVVTPNPFTVSANATKVFGVVTK